MVAANTGLPTGDRPLTDAFLAWQKFSQESPEFPIGAHRQRRLRRRRSPDEVVAAYDAPFPDDSYKAGARIFPQPGAHVARRPGGGGQPGGVGGAGRVRASRS